MFSKTYELQIIQRRMDHLDGLIGTEVYSRSELIEALLWLDEQDDIDKEISDGTKTNSSRRS
ncbi:hypothetical protein [Mesorhizobium sp. M0129]|uniref:hypothetical protein n=1 Tax=Mesorhizobium sp. M0129 TaxID=2956886 RepID=UPI00333D530E